ncbi:M14 family metallopeptidase [Zeaxanthinibacter enoshimensis]|uniref:Zinc carboxypeptidase n=1 Tax=Zeaxanthinibacter enoshimensis TaxID=392009 RepID=A0A4R6TJK7_9FLAO|nr:M14 family metallopeptidase [Zeaxanthinibacter enoshimensis]TDQ30777.1 zinc carboxypeptidase [Zeaxanthinibacter enoshimensis]
MRYLIIPVLIFFFISCETEKENKTDDFTTHFENSSGNETATYLQVIEFYIRLAREFPEVNVQTIGQTDSGRPLHLVTLNPESDFNFRKLQQEKLVIFINNGIHPGESDGIDASMMLFRDYATGKLELPENTIIVTIPVYNVGGALNRNNSSRANQEGPESYGFRGNAKNFDLNRDFIKSDSKNSRTFAQIFHLVKPDIFIDTHVSNGADYQYTLTHLFTQHDKMGHPLGSFLHAQWRPGIENALKESGEEITPYVNVYNKPPDSGFSQFMDYPRYSTGYTTLWNTLGLMIETHMLKPYKERVTATYLMLKTIVEYSASESAMIKDLRNKAFEEQLLLENYPIRWELDTTQTRTLQFRGYEADTIPSQVTGLPRLKYNREQPFTKELPYMDRYVPTDSVSIPEAYIVPRPWEEVRELLDLNKVNYTVLQKDTTMAVESYRITAYQTRTSPYEGHYPHFDTRTETRLVTKTFGEGDLLVPTAQPALRYLVETLEPGAPDSFFNWNFFDAILQRKEGFSSYVFEDAAAKILEMNPGLAREFREKKETDAGFAADSYAQLNWIYERSPYYEAAHMQYPVYRIPKK